LSSVTGSRSWLLPVRVIRPRNPLPAFPNLSAAPRPVCCKLESRWELAPSLNELELVREPPALLFRGGKCSWLLSLGTAGRSADRFRCAEPIESPKARSRWSLRSGAVFIGSENWGSLEFVVGELSSSILGADGLGRAWSSVLIDLALLSSPNRGLGFLEDALCKDPPSTVWDGVSEPDIWRSVEWSRCMSGDLTPFSRSEVEPLPLEE
jgi:hypothetical protein